MTNKIEVPLSKIRYRVILVEETSPPEGTSGIWHRYVIGEGGSRIEGKKLGNLSDVTAHAALTADDLNDRMSNQSASHYRSRRTKK